MKTTKRACLNCEKGEMNHCTRDFAYEYRGHQTTVPQISGWFCDNCEEIEFNKGEGKRYAETIESFSQKVDQQEAIELSKIRKKLRLTQHEAANLTGGGPNAFSRYERGKARPMLAIVNLFRLLNKHPELLKELDLGRKDHVNA
jgi:HTH-type transcriptional regulator/antitoxin MqsA